MFIRSSFAALVLASALGLSGMASAADTVSVQGRLTNLAGIGVDGVYALTFSLRTPDGTLVHKETQPGVKVVEGVFSVRLGTETLLAPGIFANNPVLLFTTEVGGEPVGEPVPLDSVPFAFHADTAQVGRALEVLSAAPACSASSVGRMYFDAEDQLAYFCTGAGWQAFQGPPGADGQPGEPGVDGAQGPKGDTGDIGPTGLKGDIGAQGLKGDIGPQGTKGDTGAQGAPGPQGDQGPPGDPKATYTVWGAQSCASGHTLLYKGHTSNVVGTGGSGTPFCLSESFTTAGWTNWSGGLVWRANSAGSADLRGQYSQAANEVTCAVCQGTVYVNWGNLSCAAGWQGFYDGWIGAFAGGWGNGWSAGGTICLHPNAGANWTNWDSMMVMKALGSSGDNRVQYMNTQDFRCRVCY